MTRNKCILLLIVLASYFGADIVSASSYTIYSKKLHPTRSDRSPLTNAQLADATFYNQERIDQLRLELANSRREVEALEKKVDALEASLQRFKNYYFRKM